MVETMRLKPHGYICDLINEAKASWLHLFKFSGLKPRGYICDLINGIKTSWLHVESVW